MSTKVNNNNEKKPVQEQPARKTPTEIERDYYAYRYNLYKEKYLKQKF